MKEPEAYHRFKRRIRRGVVFFHMLWIVSVVFAGVTLVTPGRRCWAVSGLLMGILSGLAARQVRERYISARKVSENPQVVYWAHPTRPFVRFSSEKVEECKLLTLHLKDGTQLEVDLPPEDMGTFIAWLKESNPFIRWGPYENHSASEKTQGV